MTNGERYKTASERRFAYQEYINKKPIKVAGEFLWLELEYNAELKPCPFCGGNAVLYVGEDSFVKCHSCDAESFHGESSDEVVAAWNRRV